MYVSIKGTACECRFAHGAQSVKCQVCNHVTPVTSASRQAAPAPVAALVTQSVVVENPADEHGNPSIAIGVTTIKS